MSEPGRRGGHRGLLNFTIVGGDATRPTVFTRQPRPGQSAPSGRLGAAARQLKRAASGSRPKGAERPPKYAKAMAAQAESFNKARPESRTAYEVGAPLRHRLHSDSVAWEAKAAQVVVNDLVKEQRELHAACGECTVRKTRDVVCIRLGCKFIVRVQSLVFGCGEQWTVHPYKVGFAPTTATDGCETWVGMKELMFFKDLKNANGLAASAFVEGLSNLEHFYTPGGSVFMGGEGTSITATLKPEQLITTMLEFGKVQDAQQDFQPAGTDPLAHCLVAKATADLQCTATRS